MEMNVLINSISEKKFELEKFLSFWIFSLNFTISTILDEEYKQYFIKSRENRLKKPLKSLLIDKKKSRKQLFQSLITFEKILADNKFFNGNNLGLPDFIFFGNFMWAEKCSSEDLFENLPNIQKWYLNIKKLNRL